MIYNIISVSGGNFKNDDGEKVSYGSVNILSDELSHRDGFSGLDVMKMKASPELIHHIKNEVPSNFEVQIEHFGRDAKARIISAKKITAK